MLMMDDTTFTVWVTAEAVKTGVITRLEVRISRLNPNRVVAVRDEHGVESYLGEECEWHTSYDRAVACAEREREQRMVECDLVMSRARQERARLKKMVFRSEEDEEGLVARRRHEAVWLLSMPEKDAVGTVLDNERLFGIYVRALLLLAAGINAREVLSDLPIERSFEWKSTDNHWDKFRELASSFAPKQIEKAGVNQKTPWCASLGNALRWFGEKSKDLGICRDAAAGKDRRKGNRRIRRYCPDEGAHQQWIRVPVLPAKDGVDTCIAL